MLQGDASWRHAIRRIAGVLFFLCTAALIVGCLLPSTASAAPVSIPVTGSTDVLYDEVRARTYIVAGDRVLRWDMVTESFLEPIVLGGSLVRLDISPDGRYLAVTDTRCSEDGRWVHIVDLADETTWQLYTTLSAAQAGTFDVAFEADGNLVVTGGSWERLCPLVRINMDTGASSWVYHGHLFLLATLMPTGDRTKVIYASGNSATVQWGLISPGLESVVALPDPGAYCADFSVNRDATRFTVSRTNLGVFGPDGGNLTWLPWGGQGRFDLQRRLLYVSERGGTDVVVLDPTTFAESGRADVGIVANSPTNNSPLGGQPMAVSGSGSVVFLGGPNAIGYAWLRDAVRGTVRSAFDGRPLPGTVVEIWASNGAAWSLEATVGAGADGAWEYSTDSTDAVRIRATDPSGGHLDAWRGGTTVDTASDVRPGRGAELPEADVVLDVADPGSVSGTVVSDQDGLAEAGIIVELWSESPGGSSAQTTVTAGDGSYSFPAVAPGSYTLWLSDETRRHETLADEIPIEITGGETVSRDETLTYVMPRLSGSVLGGPMGLTVENATVELWQNGSGGVLSLVTTLAPDADGWWEYPSESLEPFKIHVSEPTGMYADVWYGSSSGPGGAEGVFAGYWSDSWVEVTLPVANPGRIAGTVRSDHAALPLGGISVTLVSAYDDTNLAETTTTASGAYSFEDLGPGRYLVRFEDPANTHEGEWWDGQPLLADGTEIHLTTPSSFTADASLAPIPLVATFGAATATSDTVYPGQTVTLDTTVADEYGEPLAAPVLLESSKGDGVWTLVREVQPSAGDATFFSTVVWSDTAGSLLYRFRVDTTDLVVGGSSDVLSVQTLTSQAAWTPAYVLGTTQNVIVISPLFELTIEATLTAPTGGGDFPTGTVLQYSADGATYADVAGSVSGWSGARKGRRTVRVLPVRTGYYRFRTSRPGYAAELYSSPVKVTARVTSQITISSNTSSVVRPKPFILSGVLTWGVAGDPVVVYVKKPGKAYWSYSSKRICFGNVGQYGTNWWYRYTPTGVTSPRGLYYFKVAFAGDSSRSACVSPTVSVRVR